MSTTSTVYDCRDTFMNQTNSHIRSSTVDRKAVGGPVDNARSRKCSSSSVLPPQYLRMNSAHQSSNMISLSTSNNLKFDRSFSEPSDTRMASNQNQLSHINSNKYKTELCRSYDESRQCKYGEKCRYAHGSTELRTPARHPKYKTEPCRTFHSSGFCPYGPRCHFIHNEYERKSSQSPNSGPTSSSDGTSSNIVNQGSILKDNSNHSGASSSSSLSPQHSPTLPLFQTQMSQTSTSFPNNNGANLNFGMRQKSVKFNSTSSSSLGSTADSPPSSVTDSPTLSLSPLFFGEDFQGSNSAYTLSSSPSSSSSSTPLSSSSSSTSINGPTLDGLTNMSNNFDLLTISGCSQDLSTTSRFNMMTDRFLLDEKLILQNITDRSNFIQNGSFFTDKPFGTSNKFSYGMEWTFGGLPDYGLPLLQTSD